MANIENNKKVDGIKKLSPEELKRSKEIVLDTIGEGKKTVPQVAPASPIPQALMKVDSLAGRAKGKKPKEKLLKSDLLTKYKEDEKVNPAELPEAPKISKEKKSAWRKELEKVLPKDRSEAKQVETIKPGQKEKTEVLITQQKEQPSEIKKPKAILKERTPKKEPTPVAKPTLVSQINPFGNDIVKERIEKKKLLAVKAAEEKAKKEAAKKKEAAEIKETKRKELIKMKLIQDRRVKEKQKAKTARRLHRVKKREEAIKKIKSSFKSLGSNVRSILKKTVAYTGALIILAFLLYSVLSVIILQFSIDNKVTRKVLTYVPIPAYITENGIIEYYTYVDIKKSLDSQALSQKSKEADVKIAIVEKIILDDLINKYKLISEINGKSVAEQKDIIGDFIAEDMEINQVGINRIVKIKEFIDQGGDFVKVANKYGDDQNLLTITPSNFENYSYSNEVSQLEVNQISDVIHDSSGYYIFRCYSKAADSVALSYVFVAAKSLDDYISEKTIGYRMWSLVD